jgi:hypothetical protein
MIGILTTPAKYDDMNETPTTNPKRYTDVHARNTRMTA